MHSIAPNIFAEIKRCLADIELNHGVRVLYACESGSRAWGFESQDSDYDVRFIYARPRDWYLAIDVERRRDVIEVPISDDLDISGWDIRKTLQLFHKSNPPLNEWLISPIVYVEHGEFSNRLRELAPDSYNPIAAHYHYLRMADNNFRSYLKGEIVRRKKYLYVLRPLLAVKWIENELGVVPIEFDKLVASTVSDSDLRKEIEELLILKRAGMESDEGPRFHFIHSFIESEMERHGDDHNQSPGSRADLNKLNKIFLNTIENDAPTKHGT
jgi:predicted nucleotidyltransferase